jgi:hypothetical protein
MPNKMSYPQICRAEAAATAYRTAIDLIKRKTHDEALQLLESKYAEKKEQIEIWQQQKEQERVERDNKAYRDANRDNRDA